MKKKKRKKNAAPIERVRINFGNRTRYRPEKDDVPVYDRGHSSRPFRPSGLDSDPSYEDDLLMDDPDIGDR